MTKNLQHGKEVTILVSVIEFQVKSKYFFEEVFEG